MTTRLKCFFNKHEFEMRHLITCPILIGDHDIKILFNEREALICKHCGKEDARA